MSGTGFWLPRPSTLSSFDCNYTGRCTCSRLAGCIWETGLPLASGSLILSGVGPHTACQTQVRHTQVPDSVSDTGAPHASVRHWFRHRSATSSVRHYVRHRSACVTFHLSAAHALSPLLSRLQDRKIIYCNLIFPVSIRGCNTPLDVETHHEGHALSAQVTHASCKGCRGPFR